MGPVKQGGRHRLLFLISTLKPLVSFGSIDDVSTSISFSHAAIPAVKSEGVQSSATVASSGHVNGKPSVSSAPKPSVNPPNGSSTSTTASSSVPSSTTARPAKIDMRKFFQGASSSLPPRFSLTIYATSCPPCTTLVVTTRSTTTAILPALTIRLSSYNFPPSRGPPTQYPNLNSARPPVFPHQQMTNGTGSRPPPGGPNAPGGPPVSAGLASPRLGHPHPNLHHGDNPQVWLHPPNKYPCLYPVGRDM